MSFFINVKHNIYQNINFERYSLNLKLFFTVPTNTDFSSSLTMYSALLSLK